MSILKPHVSLNVSNIEASVAFYSKAFGVGPVKRRPDYAKFDLKAPLLNLTMQEAPRTGINASHFGVQVSDSSDVANAKSRFEAAGLSTFTEDDVSCCYAVQDKVWVTDPDGNAWEVFVVKADADVMKEPVPTKGAACCDPGCCTPSAQKAPTPSKNAACCDPGCCAPSAQNDAAL